MIISSQDAFLIDTETICFKQMYRCQKCTNVVHGIPQEDKSVICEKCESALYADDEIAFRLDAEQ